MPVKNQGHRRSFYGLSPSSTHQRGNPSSPARMGPCSRLNLESRVTKRFRDFTPGEFVYRNSHLFTDRGFRRVFTPPGMIAPYYDRLGFQKAGDAYCLEW
jgi:hypothetical protein